MISKRLSRQAESSSRHRQPQKPHLLSPPTTPRSSFLLLTQGGPVALWAEPRRLSPSQQPCEWCKEEGPSCVRQHRARSFLLTSPINQAPERVFIPSTPPLFSSL